MDLDSDSNSNNNEDSYKMDEEARHRDGMFFSLVGVGTSLCASYYLKYLNKQKRRISKLSGIEWVRETLDTHGESYRMFRMEPHVFQRLLDVLVQNYGLRPSMEISVEEALAMFLWTCGHNQSNRNVQNRFKHSGETVSRKFGDVLEAILRLSVDIIKPSDYEFREVPKKIQNSDRYWPHFKGCIGAIDGTHVRAKVPTQQKVPYLGRKRYPTQNVMVVCDFDLLFTFVISGWPGSAHDAKILATTLQDHNDVFPHPPNGNIALNFSNIVYY